MRFAVSLLFAASLLAGGCTVRTTETSSGAGGPTGADVPDPPPPPRAPASASAGVAAEPPAPGVLPEVVYLFMLDKEGGTWMCTATLIARDRALTAAHCLDTDQFVAYEIVAPNAPGRPEVEATSPRVFGGPFSDVANPDAGVLTLRTPIDLPAYAELTDVVARVEAGEDVQAAAVVRTAEEAEAPFEVEGGLSVSSTVEYGYMHGFGTPMFSKGGDSGAGLFLVEGGAITHKLIGVERQPEPTRELDHFTRVDADLLAWYATTPR